MSVPSGLRPQFPKRAAYLKQVMAARRVSADDEVRRLGQFSRDGAFTHRYAADLPDLTYDWSSTASDLASLASVVRDDAIVRALNGQDDWLNPWARATAYSYWEQRVEHCLQRRIHADHAAGRRPQYLGMCKLHRSAFAIGCCFALGWDDWAFELAERSSRTQAIGGFADGGDETHRRAAHAVHRLACEAKGQAWSPEPACVCDDPVIQAVLEHTFDADDAALALLALQVLDRHTHESRPDGNKGFFDFPWLDEWYVPYEVLAILRLRQCRGLPIGALQSLPHPLFATPLGRLHLGTPPYADEFLRALLDRLRADIPDL